MYTLPGGRQLNVQHDFFQEHATLSGLAGAAVFEVRCGAESAVKVARHWQHGQWRPQEEETMLTSVVKAWVGRWQPENPRAAEILLCAPSRLAARNPGVNSRSQER